METKNYAIVDSVEKLQEAIARTREAQQKFATYTQEQVDKIFLAAASAANKARISLAKLAVLSKKIKPSVSRRSRNPLVLLLLLFLQPTPHQQLSSSALLL